MSRAITPRAVTLGDDKKHYLKYGINGIVAFEKESGMSVGEMAAMDEERTSMGLVRALVWAGLQNETERRHHGESPDILAAGDLMDGCDLNATSKLASEALRDAMETPEVKAHVEAGNG